MSKLMRFIRWGLGNARSKRYGWKLYVLMKGRVLMMVGDGRGFIRGVYMMVGEGRGSISRLDERGI